VVDLVGHRRLHEAQHARLPERDDLATQRLLGPCRLFVGLRPAVAFRQQVGDGLFAVQRASPLHLRRVRGQDGADERLVEKLAQTRRANAARLHPVQSERQAPLPRRRPR
jgi:hypothetical protein